MTDTPSHGARTISADEIADRLGLHRPTEQQRAIIESPLVPALVLAGAGSGKTETMAFRALWLVANGHVAPGEILGLTFTRKAAGELAERMRERIAALREHGLIPDRQTDEVVDPAAELLDAPTVATYNSFATGIFREHAALVGFDGDAVVLGEAAAWLLAREVALASDDPRLGEADQSLDRVTGAIVALSGAIADNLADPESIRQMALDFTRLRELPAGGTGQYPEVDKAVGYVAALPGLLDAAEQFARAKAERGYIQYSDQVAIALKIARRDPRVAEALRERYRVVILDEYQDTSVAQSELLSTLFRGHPVMAVGDPHQSIYGWRGASAANLAGFSRWFEATQRYELTTSWRNGVHILDAANRILEPLAAVTPVSVARLEPRPGADALPVFVEYPDRVDDEARAVARWFKERLDDRARWKQPKGGGEPEPPSAALLLRARATLEHFIRAFRDEGVPFHVLGVGGLLAEPVVADLVAALAVVDDPGAGSELIRLLVGSRWRIGTADIAALRELARWLERRDLRQQQRDDPVREALRASVAEGESASIVDALDFLATAPEGHGGVRGFSEPGLERLREAGRLFARLRGRTRLELADLVLVVLQELGLDIEAEANESRRGSGRALEAFFDAVSDFEQLGHGATLGAFLGWLREAEARDRLSPRSEPPEAGCVQLLTIHGAKGLEWDLVAVPRLVEGELPEAARDTGAWLSYGGFPYEFRGDRDSVPQLAWRGAATRVAVRDAIKDFKDGIRERQLEEARRLAYVAVTRARHELLLSGSFWSSPLKPRGPSRFLVELEQAGLVPPLPEAPEADENPMLTRPDPAPWPRDPLGGRRERVERAAREVRAASPALVGPWARELELLIEERRRQLAGGEPQRLPERIPASRFSEFVHDPDAVLARLRRPMPERPYRQTRLGTIFHSWVERRSAPVATSDELDVLAEELDEEYIALDAAELDRLKRTFESSPWGSLRPVEVEREIHLPFDGRVVVCKIDAVYKMGDRYEVVDWKTGKPPADAADLERKQLQLALYRLAYARWADLDPALIDAAFYFVAEDRIIRPPHIDTEEELLARWRRVVGEPDSRT